MLLDDARLAVAGENGSESGSSEGLLNLDLDLGLGLGFNVGS